MLKWGSRRPSAAYGPEQGYDFLREAIARYYEKKGVTLTLDEIFVSDGAKSDVGNILDLFDKDNTVLVPDPVYPVYVDTNVMAGRKVVYANATAENGFLPMPDDSVGADIIYICSPNNPTGAVYTHDQLKAWVEYAKKKGAVILFDAADECFVADSSLPRSIYEVEGAKEVAIEFCSFSKTAGFTGTRCGYTVVPKALIREGAGTERFLAPPPDHQVQRRPLYRPARRGSGLHRGGPGPDESEHRLLPPERPRSSRTPSIPRRRYTGGQKLPLYLDGVPLRDEELGHSSTCCWRRPGVVGTPGAGFGKNGEGFFRLTAFNDHENTAEAAERLKKLLGELLNR